MNGLDHMSYVAPHHACGNPARMIFYRSEIRKVNLFSFDEGESHASLLACALSVWLGR